MNMFSLSNQRKLFILLLLLGVPLLVASAKKKKEEELLINCYKCTNCWSLPKDRLIGCRGKQDRCIKIESDEGIVMRDCADEWGAESDKDAGKKCNGWVDGFKTCYCDTDGCNQASLPRQVLITNFLLKGFSIIMNMLRL